jgi:hypothetical protein
VFNFTDKSLGLYFDVKPLLCKAHLYGYSHQRGLSELLIRNKTYGARLRASKIVFIKNLKI